MTREERHQWILDYLWAEWARMGTTTVFIDSLNSSFVDDYLEATKAKFHPMPYGAHKCPQLGKDLGDLYRLGKLKRHSTGISELSGMGFPKWTWSYSLP